MFGMLLKSNTRVTGVVSNYLNFANDDIGQQDWTNVTNAQTDNNVRATCPNAGLGNAWNSDIFRATGHQTLPPAYAIAVTGIRWRIRIQKNTNDGVSNTLVQWHEYVNNVRTGLQVDFTDITTTEQLMLAEVNNPLNQRTVAMSPADFSNANTGVGFQSTRGSGSGTLQQHLLDHIFCEYDYEY
jgi:hypothetical protein